MAQGSAQWLELIDESAYGVTQTTSPLAIWIPLDGNNAFTPVPVVPTQNIHTADSRNEPAIRLGGKTWRYGVAGKLTCLAYADVGGTTGDTVSFADRIFDWATTIGATGFTNDTKSYTVRHFDGIRAREYLGMKVMNLTFTGTLGTDIGAFKFDLDLVGQQFNATDPSPFAEPALTVFPRSPFHFTEGAGGLVLATSGSTARTQVKSVTLSIKNTLDASFDDLPYITDCTYQGRDVTLSANLRFKSKTDRDNYESQTKHTTVSYAVVKASPAKTLTLSLQGNAYIDSMDRALNLNAPTYETLHLSALRDTATGKNFSYTVV